MNIDDLYLILRAGHAQAQAIVDAVSDPLIVLDQSFCVQAASRSFYTTFKVERINTIGKSFYELGSGQWDIPALRHVLETVIPQSLAVINYQVEHDFPGIGHRIMLVSARTLEDPATATRTMLLSIKDVTARHEKDAATALVFGELKHRMQNLLAVTYALARHTKTEGRTAEEYRDAFLGRFTALTAAHAVIYGEDTFVGLKELAEKILAPYAPSGMIVMEGDADFPLAANKLLSLGMVLHELATNASKYGALSVPDGKIHLSWMVADAPKEVQISWVEKGGPFINGAPITPGYGTSLIDSTVIYSLKGRVNRRFEQAGLAVDLIIPIELEEC